MSIAFLKTWMLFSCIFQCSIYSRGREMKLLPLSGERNILQCSSIDTSIDRKSKIYLAFSLFLPQTIYKEPKLFGSLVISAKPWYTIPE